MRHRMIAVSAWVLMVPVSVRAGIAVEQIEAYETDSGDNPNAPTRYAPVDFAGASSLTLQAGQLGGFFSGITFHALGGTTATNSNHAYAVGASFYGDATVAYPFVSDVYAAPDTSFLTTTVGTQSATGIAAAPGAFAPGAVVINNSYVYTTGSAPSDLDLQRRLDFMIDESDTTFVSAAVSNSGGTNFDIPWSSFNALAVTGGQQTFTVTGSQGKQHADLYVGGEASFSSAAVSSDAAALYGTAQANGMTDALHGVMIRSLLMAGADKTSYVRQTANNLSVSEGAGLADYSSSLAILNAGEKPLLPVNGSNAVVGSPTSDQRGWAYGTIPAGARDVVLFHAANGVTGVTASLNWDVTQSQPAAGEINTLSSGTIFADLRLELLPVTLSNGSYVLGASLSDTTLQSNATGDNVQYLYSTSTLAAGDYALVITGDPALSTPVGFSYSLAGSFPDAFEAAAGGSWAATVNWAGGIVANAPAAQATFSGATGVAAATLTLDGNKTVGQLFFSGTTTYTIAPGTGGTLTIDDTGDTSGTALVSVSSGNHVISAAVNLVNGLTASIAASSSLDISGAISGTGGLTKSGAGTLTLDGADNFGPLTINTGTVTLTTTASLGGAVTINSGGVLKLAASTGTGILVHALGAPITLASGATVTVADPASAANRQLIVTSDITFAGTTGNWAGEFDLGVNDLDLPAGSLADVTNQIKQGLTTGSSTGLISSVALADTTHFATLGVISNTAGNGNALYGSTTALGEFDGISPGVNAVLVKYTFLGDANLDGTVNAADFALINAGFTGHLTGWYNGDFNYDGTVDGSDYTLIDDAFNNQGGAPNSTAEIATPTTQLAASAAVPEPAMVGLLACAAGVLRRRRSA